MVKREPSSDRIVELVECPLFAANAYLAAGYHLIDAFAISALKERTDGTRASWVRRSVLYVLGRPVGVAAIEPAKAIRPVREPKS